MSGPGGWSMRFFVALVVFSFGIGFYAAAALAFDRRRALHGWLYARRRRAAAKAAAKAGPKAGDGPGGRAGGEVGGGPGSVATAAAIGTLPVNLTIAAFLLIGTVLTFGSCAGLIVW
jgi:hypothetical protein